MSETVRVGVIGTSWYADMMHLPNLKSHPQAQICAICGRNRARASEMAKKYEIPQVFTDYQDMVAHGDLQALVVAAPDDLHYPMAMAGLDAGLHVLCEKALALNAAQAKEMYERAEAAGVKHMVFYTYRWMPVYRYARQLVQEGYIGRCFHGAFRYLGGYARGGNYRWRFDRQRSNGALGDLGSHTIHLAQWLVGDIAQVSAHLGTYVERPGPDGQSLDPANDAVTMVVQFANGAQGSMQFSAVAHVGERGQEQHLVLHGEEGTLEIDVSWPGGSWTVEMRGVRQGEKAFQVIEVPEALWGEAEPHDDMGLWTKASIGDRWFIDAILEDRPAVPTFYDGYRVQAVIDAAVESHEQGTWVAVV